MGDSRLLQESNLTTRQQSRAPHHVIHLILQTPPPSEWRTSLPYGDAEFASLMEREFASTNAPWCFALLYGNPFSKTDAWKRLNMPWTINRCLRCSSIDKTVSLAHYCNPSNNELRCLVSNPHIPCQRLSVFAAISFTSAIAYLLLKSHHVTILMTY